MKKQAYEVLSQITPQMIKELGLYASSVSRNLRWRTENFEELPGGETPGSIVSKAIKLVLQGALEEPSKGSPPFKAGVRRWDPQKHPDLKKYLMDVIDSLLSNLVKSRENRIFIRTSGDKERPAWETGQKAGTADTEWLARPSRSPEELLLQKKVAEYEERALDMLEDEAKDRNDEVLTKVIEAMREGHAEAAEIAEAKKIPIKDVYNANKRLNRTAEAVSRRLKGIQTKSARRRAK